MGVKVRVVVGVAVLVTVGVGVLVGVRVDRDTHNPAKIMRDFRTFFSCEMKDRRVVLNAYLKTDAQREAVSTS